MRFLTYLPTHFVSSQLQLLVGTSLSLYPAQHTHSSASDMKRDVSWPKPQPNSEEGERDE